MTIPGLFPLLHVLRKSAGYQFPRLGSFYSLVRACAPASVEIELFEDVHVQLDLADEVHFQTYWYGTRFEEPTGAVLTSWWEHAHHFFDIGSNYGFFSLWAASLGGDLTIHAFEPNPITFAKLDGFAKTNGFDAIIRNSFALSNAEGMIALQLEEDNSGASHMVAAESKSSQLAVANVHTLRFDQYAADLNLDPLSCVVKIDVEGMELRVLQGMTEALSKKVFRGICIELLEENLMRASTSPAEVDALLRRYGYTPERLGGRSADLPQNHHNVFYVPS